MTKLKWTLLAALVAVFVLPSFLLAEEEPIPAPVEKPTTTEGTATETDAAKPAKMDDRTKEVFEGYEKKLYHLGRAGVKTASYVMNVKVTSMMAGDVGGKATYDWDGEKSTLTWDNSQLGMMLGQQGFSQKDLDERFKQKSIVDDLDGTTLAAKDEEDGSTRVTVTGETKEGYKSFLFGADGLLSAIVMSVDPMGSGQKQDLTAKMTHTKKGETYLMDTMSFGLEIPGMGTFDQVMTFTYIEVNGFTVPSKMVADQKMAGQEFGALTVEFAEWKLNEDKESDEGE